MVLEKTANRVINHIEIGCWELKKNKSFWSSAFIKSLGYLEKDLKIELDFFLNNLIHKDDSNLFRNNFFSFVKSNTHFKQSIFIKSKKGKYKEFVCTTNNNLSDNLKQMSKFIYFNKRKIKTNKKVRKDKFYYQETAEMTQTGSWFVDFIKKKSYWDEQTRRILGYPQDYIPSIKNSSQYYAKEHYELAVDIFYKCAMGGKAFDVEIKMLTANQNEFWTRAIGKPIYNNNEDIIGIRGVFQNIDDVKLKEINIQKTSDIIASQNSRLFNFAHIVSHNLKSHTSNLSLIVQLFEDVKTPEEKIEFIDNIKDISESLNSTIEHLNEVVTMQTNTSQNKTTVDFKKILTLVSKSIGRIINDSKVTINSDFNEAPTLEYIPAYLESIILNLVTNGIKYKHPNRNPVISLRTYKKEGNIFLEVNDNGVGIDLEKFGDELFGMYKTFHYNKDAVGIGLFMTKNQIVSLNGEINVESEVGKGTTFKIEF